MTPGCISWKEAKGTQPVVDCDNHQALVHQHLWSETDTYTLTCEVKLVFDFDIRSLIPSFKVYVMIYDPKLSPIFPTIAHFKATTVHLKSL